MGLTHRRKKIAEKIEKSQPLAVKRVKKRANSKRNCCLDLLILRKVLNSLVVPLFIYRRL